MNIEDYNKKKRMNEEKMIRVREEEINRKYFWISLSIVIIAFFILYPEWFVLIFIDSIEGLGSGLIILALLMFFKGK